MKGSGSSGGGGAIGIIIAIIAGIGGLVLVHKLVPSLFYIFLWGIIILVILIIATIILVVVLANKSGKEKDESTAAGFTTVSEDLTDEQRQILIEARQKLMELRRAISQIYVIDVRTAANEVCGVLDKILQTLKEKPDQIRNSRQCLNYYIPTLKDVLTHFKQLESKNQLDPLMKGKTLNFLKDVKAALEKYYNSLYEDEKLDMEVDMEAMTIAIKREGLLE